ncbi:hypothetical protein EVAR_95809_1 [Eumeta japonica]|uniref:Uncharacterized protein n=1 Tax=Eumeta variegata TaxID=151549 RepID=A0A4C1W503_EUMVA|nr:hypothetical protein EVAR_95809_1 [Eumeta japonica]
MSSSYKGIDDRTKSGSWLITLSIDVKDEITRCVFGWTERKYFKQNRYADRYPNRNRKRNGLEMEGGSSAGLAIDGVFGPNERVIRSPQRPSRGQDPAMDT